MIYHDNLICLVCSGNLIFLGVGICGFLLIFSYFFLITLHAKIPHTCTKLENVDSQLTTKKNYKSFVNSYNSIILENWSIYLLFILRIVAFDVMRLQLVYLMYLEYIKLSVSYYTLSRALRMSILHIIP